MSRQATSRLLHLLRGGIVEVDMVDGDGRGRVYRLRPERLVALTAWLDQVQAGHAAQLAAFRRHAEGEENGAWSWVDAAAGAVSATVVVALPPAEAFRMFTAEIGSWYVVDPTPSPIRAHGRHPLRAPSAVGSSTSTARRPARARRWAASRRGIRGGGSGSPTGAASTPRCASSRPGAARRSPSSSVASTGCPRATPSTCAAGWHLLLGWFAAAVGHASRPDDDDHDHPRDEERRCPRRPTTG